MFLNQMTLDLSTREFLLLFSIWKNESALPMAPAPPIQQTPSKNSQQRPREKLVYSFVAGGSQAECDFALVIYLSFHWFGIRSCLATMWRLSSN